MAPACPSTASAARCRHFEACGGCPWQDVPYAEQLRRKQHTVQELLRRELGAPGTPEVRPTLAADDPPWGFRTKVHFVFGPGDRGRGLIMGHYRRGAQAIVPVEECPVHVEQGNRLAFAFRDALRRAGIAGVSRDLRSGLARHLVVRVATDSAQALATLVVTRNDKALRPAVRSVVDGPASPAGVHVSVHDRQDSFLFGPSTVKVSGVSHVRERVAGINYLISPTSFFQTNIQAAERIVGLVARELAGVGSVVDLFAGAGLFSLPLAHAGARVLAVEESASSVADGEASQRLNRIPESRCRFVRARVEDVAAGRQRRSLPSEADAVVMDPPRQGCAPAVLTWVAGSLRPAVLVYVSCNPEALATDAGRLGQLGYRLRAAQPVDMFPHTSHIETVATFERAG